MTSATAQSVPVRAVAHRSRRERLAARLAESRGQRVLWMLLGLWILNAFDLVLTMLAHQHGLLDEFNPIAARVLPLGPGMVFLYKTVLVAGGTATLIIYRHRLIAEATSAFMLFVYALVAIQWKLCYEMYELTFLHSPDPGNPSTVTGGVSVLLF